MIFKSRIKVNKHLLSLWYTILRGIHTQVYVLKKVDEEKTMKVFDSMSALIPTLQYFKFVKKHLRSIS